jgi:hypothetical protein
VAEPEWLTRLFTPNPAAFQPWESTIERAQVSDDGSHLLLYLSTDRGEVPAIVDVRDTDERVELRVHIGIDPEHPPRLPGVGPSSRPGQRRAHYAGREVHWPVRVPLARPLAGRPVYDMGSNDSDARWAARFAWYRER